LGAVSLAAGRIDKVADEGPAKWRGIRTIGADMQISDIKITIDDDGKPTLGQPKVKLRTAWWLVAQGSSNDRSRLRAGLSHIAEEAHHRNPQIPLAYQDGQRDQGFEILCSAGI
jgi:hypothetical protein